MKYGSFYKFTYGSSPNFVSNIKWATKFYFMHYSHYLVIILFKRICTYFFWESSVPSFCVLCVLCLLFVDFYAIFLIYTMFWIWLNAFVNECLYKCCQVLYDFFSHADLGKHKNHVIKVWLWLVSQKNMHPEREL